MTEAELAAWQPKPQQLSAGSTLDTSTSLVSKSHVVIRPSFPPTSVEAVSQPLIPIDQEAWDESKSLNRKKFLVYERYTAHQRPSSRKLSELPTTLFKHYYQYPAGPRMIDSVLSIVAVHGLNGSALGTWTTLESGICWLNDPQFLPKYVKNARVLVWGYNASFSSLTGHVPSKDRIHHHAHTLVANLAADRLVSVFAVNSI